MDGLLYQQMNNTQYQHCQQQWQSLHELRYMYQTSKQMSGSIALFGGVCGLLCFRRGRNTNDLLYSYAFSMQCVLVEKNLTFVENKRKIFIT